MRPRLSPVLFLALGLLATACGDDGPTGPGTADLEILILRGDDQFGEPGSLLPLPLEVRVQDLADGRGVGGVRVRWEILEGGGAALDQRTTLTDSVGLSSVRLTLGQELGTYRVRASVNGMLSGPADFDASVILPPELTLVPDYPVRAGDTIRLEGRNLSAIPEEDVVTFSRVRGRVVSASSTELMVEVPPCLPSRLVDLRVQIGALATPAVGLRILGGSQYLYMEVGQDTVFDAGEGLSCFRLPSVPGSRYLVVPHTTGTVGGGLYDLSWVGLTTEGLPAGPSEGNPAPGRRGGDRSDPAPDPKWEWDARLRALEGAGLRGWRAAGAGGGPTAPAEASPARVPQIGDEREFNVLNADNEFDRVTARIRYVSEHTLLYMDDDAPAGGFASTDLVRLADQFEQAIYPAVTEAFGAESDLDANGRVIILLTPAVNRLTPSGTDGYVGGFFFGVDLLTDRSGSNEGEIFYAVVPDPAGIHGPPLVRSTLLYSLPAILAHEFEHMIHFNQRILVSGAESQDALWLSEAMAQMAEDLVGAAYLERGDPEKAQQFQMGNWSRARRFLLEPGGVSVLATLPPGTLAERGAGWLLLKFLHGQASDGTLLRLLTASTRTGVPNLTQAAGRPWAGLISDWAGAMYLDGLPVPVRTGLRFLGINLRYVVTLIDGRFPLIPPELGRVSFTRTLSLWSSAPDYYIITTPTAGGLALNLSGLEGRPPHPASGLRVLVVRLD